MGGVLVDAGTRVVGCCCCPGLGDQPSRGTARHVSGVQKYLRCTKRNPRKNLGTLGGAEGSQKGTHATAKGCSGVRGCRPGGRGGCIPIWGLAFHWWSPVASQPHAAGEKLLVSLCHSPPSAKGTLQQLGCGTGFRKTSSYLVLFPPFLGLYQTSRPCFTNGETEAQGEALRRAVSIPTRCPNPPGSIAFPARR